MIIFDDFGHMVSTESVEELHAFARKIGLKREWYQTPGYGDRFAHYDLTTSRMMRKAANFGAKKVDPRELLKLAWWRAKE